MKSHSVNSFLVGLKHPEKDPENEAEGNDSTRRLAGLVKQENLVALPRASTESSVHVPVKVPVPGRGYIVMCSWSFNCQ